MTTTHPVVPSHQFAKAVHTSAQIGRGVWRGLVMVALAVSLLVAARVEAQALIPQVITFGANPGPITFTPIGFFGVTANGGASGNPVTFTSLTPTVCSPSPATGGFAMHSAGICTVGANQAGNATYAAAPQVTQSITINPALIPQTIEFEPLEVGEVLFSPGGTFVVFSSNFSFAQSYNMVTITSLAPSVCTVGNSSVVFARFGTRTFASMTIHSRGRCTIVANQAGNASFAAALPVNLNIDILREAQTITVVPIPQTRIGDAPFSVIATASSGLPVTLSADQFGGACSVTGTTVTILRTGYCYLGASQAGNASYAPVSVGAGFDILRRAQSITFAPIADRPMSPTPFPISATASSGLPVTNIYALNGGCHSTYDNSVTPSVVVVQLTGVGTCTVVARHDGNSEYDVARTERTFNITRGTQTIVAAPIADTTYSNFGSIATNARASSERFDSVNPISLTPTVCSTSTFSSTISVLTAGLCTVRFSHPGNANYFPAPDVDVSFTIAKRAQQISFSVGTTSTILGNAPVSLGAFAFSPTVSFGSNGNAVTVTSDTPQICSVSGNTVTFIGSGTCSLTATQPGNNNYLPATPVTRTIQVAARAAVQSSSVIARFGDMQTLTTNIAGISPTGTVRFSLATGEVIPGCNAVPVVNASASCLIPPRYQSRDPLVFSIDYSGDSRNPAGTTWYTQPIFYDTAALSTSVEPANPVPASGRATVTALVRMRNPVGTVSFVTDEYAPVTQALIRTPLAGCDARPLTMLPNAVDSAVATCTLTAPASGNVKVTAIYRYPSGHVSNRTTEEESQSITVVANAPTNYTDMWWGGVRENGWGVSITQHGATQFNVIFAYDSAGKPIWYVMPGCTWSAANTVCSGSLYQPTGAPFSAYDVTRFAANPPVGTASFTYKSANTATLNYTILGVAGSKEIERQTFGAATSQPNLGVNDLWWNGAAENGWGINIAQQGRQLFPVWYTYGADGRTTFFTVPGGTWDGLVFTGDIYTTTSSPWLGVPYDASRFAATKVGTMIIDYRDANTATITYTIGTVIQTKVIRRQEF